jgi:hypothetical protein
MVIKKFWLLVQLVVTLAQDPVCNLAPDTLLRFKYETFYGWHASEGNFTNIGQSSSPKELTAFYNQTGRPGMLEVQKIFFQDIKIQHPTLRGLMVNPTGIANWEAMQPMVRGLVDQGIIIGFMLGDELVYNNISWVDLNATASIVKSAFPDRFVYYNEGGAPLWGNHNVNHMRTEYPHIPGQ